MLPETEIQNVIARIIVREGGHSNDPADRGGDTYWGATKPFAQEWGIPWPPQVIEDVSAGYRRALAGWRIDQIDDAATLDLVADCCVNHGAGKGIKWLQRALGVQDDGVIGPQTLGVMVHLADWNAVYRDVLTERFLFYAAIVVNDATQLRFLKGWLNRACSFIK